MKKIIGIFAVTGMMSQVVFAGPVVNLPMDLTVVGPGGEVLIYYKDGNDIVVRNCGANYPIVKSRSDCATVGQENRVPVAAFKRVLESEFRILDADKLKPLTPDEVAAFRGGDPARLKQVAEREKELDAKLARIQTFIQSYGGDAKSTADQAETSKLLEAARKELSTAKMGGAAIKKVNDLIQELVDKKIASSEVTSVSSGKNSDQAAYTLLKQFDASRAECGTDEILNGTSPDSPGNPANPKAGRGAKLENFLISTAYAAEITIESRIKDCAPLPGSSKTTKAGVAWNLVARKRDRTTGKFSEVWKDSKGLIWGDRLDSTYTHYNAVALDLKGQVAQEKACVSDDGKHAQAGISGKSFGLPKIEEFQQAEKDGIREVVPNMQNSWFWSASLNPSSTSSARGFYGYYGYSYYGYREDYGSVRCVGR